MACTLRAGLWVQASLLLVLTESFKVYKAISEGLINLADRFFEMEYLDALQGLEAYKESLVANERLQVRDTSLWNNSGNPQYTGSTRRAYLTVHDSMPTCVCFNVSASTASSPMRSP